MLETLSVKCQSPEQQVNQLSGGNQQKVVLGRWLLARPKVLILDEPTRGVDVGAKEEIHQRLRKIGADGCAIVMVSSELPEIMAYSDRILVLRSGRLAATFDTREVDAATVAEAAIPDTDTEEKHAPKTSPAWTEYFPAWRGGPWSFEVPLGEAGLLLVIMALSIWLGMTSHGFFELANLANLASETVLWTILGLAAAVVIIAGGIDISIGSLLALCAAVAGLILKSDLLPAVSIPLAVAAACLVGTTGGLLNGTLSLVGRIHPIVVTLGMIFFYRGITIALLRGQQISSLPAAFGSLSIHHGSGIRGMIVVGVVVTIVIFLFLSHAKLGRHLYALGASFSAAALVGISHRNTWLTAFGLSGLLVGMAGVMELSSSMQMQAQLGKGWELQAIAVAVIGGVSITGGRGSVLGVVLGALLLQLVNSALVRWQIRGSQVDLVIGGMILIAVVLDLLWRKLQR